MPSTGLLDNGIALVETGLCRRSSEEVELEPSFRSGVEDFSVDGCFDFLRGLGPFDFDLNEDNLDFSGVLPDDGPFPSQDPFGRRPSEDRDANLSVCSGLEGCAVEDCFDFGPGVMFCCFVIDDDGEDFLGAEFVYATLWDVFFLDSVFRDVELSDSD